MAATPTAEIVLTWRWLLDKLSEAERAERREGLESIELALRLRDGRRQRWRDPVTAQLARQQLANTWARKRAQPSVELSCRATGKVERLTLEAAARRVRLSVVTLRNRLAGGRSLCRLLDEDIVTLRRLTPAERALCTSDAPQA